MPRLRLAAFYYRPRLRNRGWSLPTLYGPGTSSFHIVSRLAPRRDLRASERASVLRDETYFHVQMRWKTRESAGSAIVLGLIDNRLLHEVETDLSARR